jgi:hypothetical protein
MFRAAALLAPDASRDFWSLGVGDAGMGWRQRGDSRRRRAGGDGAFGELARGGASSRRTPTTRNLTQQILQPCAPHGSLSSHPWRVSSGRREESSAVHLLTKGIESSNRDCVWVALGNRKACPLNRRLDRSAERAGTQARSSGTRGWRMAPGIANRRLAKEHQLFTRRRVLLVDEDCGDLQYYCTILEQDGYEVQACRSYAEGVQCL